MAKDGEELGPLVSVHIDDSVQLLLKSEKEAENYSKQHRGSIYMVPSVYRRLSPHSYTPKVVSIGPLHHDDEHLKGFEVQKAAYLHSLLHNISDRDNSKPEQILKECVTKVSGSIDRIKACYIGMKAYTDYELVNMMVMDACFIFAFIYSFRERDFSIGQSLLMYPHIFLDLILIENQIPYFVLQDIFDCTFLNHYPSIPTLSELIFGFIAKPCNIFEGDLVMDSSSISSTHYHIVDFIHKSYQNPDRDSSGPDKIVKAQSVVELHRSGVRFSAKHDAKWPMAMELKYSRFLCFPLSWSKPTLKMPVLQIDDSTESFIRNLIMYEQSCEGLQTCVTSYMCALDMLIDTPEDVARLVKSKVLINDIGSNEEAAGVINKMLKEVSLREFYYLDEWKKMDEYYNAYWPNHIAELRRNYFSNPWSIIALIAGTVLFVLTVVQTVYAVKAGDNNSMAA